MDEQAKQLAHEHAQESAAVLLDLGEYRIRSNEEISIASESIVEAKRRWKILDDKEKEITAPLHAALKAARDLFRAPKEQYSRVEAVLKKALALHAEEEAARNRQIMELAAQAHKQGDLRTQVEALSLATDMKHAAPQISTRQVRKFRIVDAAAVPREYLMIDETAIKEAMRAWRTVPGVEYYFETQVAARGA